jgi:hypothetical protein
MENRRPMKPADLFFNDLCNGKSEGIPVPRTDDLHADGQTILGKSCGNDRRGQTEQGASATQLIISRYEIKRPSEHFSLRS